MTQFSDLGLAEGLLKALAAEGYDTPTSIQTQAIPHVLAGRDVVGLAQTGTGKTAAFATPMLQRLTESRKQAGIKTVRALVLAPTRELAAQICDSFRAYGRYVGVSAQVVFGGVPLGKQINSLSRGVDVLVATPGRLLDLVSQRAVNLSQVEILVVDEADHMMDMGFIVPLNRIVKLLPKQRQTLFFSATMPPAIEQLAQAFVNNPVRVEAAPVASTVDRINQGVIHVDRSRKMPLLVDLLKDQSIERALVFARTKHGANRLAEQLYENGIIAEAIHGNKSQGQRTRALESFKNGRARLLIATDIAARGIDVDGVTHVFNFDLPDVPEAYVHRIGRTARAGREGVAIAFCAGDERALLRDVEKLIRRQIPVLAHALGQLEPITGGPDRPARGGRSQGRPGGQGHGRGQRSNAGGFGGDRQRRPERTERPWSNAGAEERPRTERAPVRNEQQPVRADARPEGRAEPRQERRPERSDRPYAARTEHRGERSHAPRSERPERAERPQRNDRPERTEQRFEYRAERPDRAPRTQERAYGHGGAHGHPTRRPEGRGDAPRFEGRGEGRGPKTNDAPRGAAAGERGKSAGAKPAGKPGKSMGGGRRAARSDRPR
ncbi:MAG: DEAD/DEAH box helicase [Caulobacterales bacterium]